MTIIIIDLILHPPKSMLETLKMRAAAEVLGIDDTTARVLAMIHTRTQGGKIENPFVLTHGETLEQRLGIWSKFKDRQGPIGEAVRDTIRLYEDSEFRENMLNTYRNILPQMKGKGFLELFTAMLLKELEDST